MNKCPAGHILDEENGYVRTKTRAGKIECRACNRENRPLSLEVFVGDRDQERIPELLPMYPMPRPEVVKKAEELLAMMRPTEQEVVIYWMNGVPMETVAEWLGQPKKKVQSYKDHAIKKVRKKVQ